jgi:hypothetical protein
MSLIAVPPRRLNKSFHKCYCTWGLNICLKFEDFWLEMKVSMKKLSEMKNDFSVIFSIHLLLAKGMIDNFEKNYQNQIEHKIEGMKSCQNQGE